MFSLDNKIAVITGGGSGIGKAIAKLFAKQGAIVHILNGILIPQMKLPMRSQKIMVKPLYINAMLQTKRKYLQYLKALVQ